MKCLLNGQFVNKMTFSNVLTADTMRLNAWRWGVLFPSKRNPAQGRRNRSGKKYDVRLFVFDILTRFLLDRHVFRLEKGFRHGFCAAAFAATLYSSFYSDSKCFFFLSMYIFTRRNTIQRLNYRKSISFRGRMGRAKKEFCSFRI